MKRFNKVALSVAAFGLANIAFAGSYSEACDCEVTVAKYAGGVRVGVEALYLSADIKNTEYAVSYQVKDSVDTFRSHNVSSDHDWGYAIELAYAAAGTGNDFLVNWTSVDLHGSDTIVTAAGSNGQIFGGTLGLVDMLDDFVTFAPGGNITELDALASAKGSYDVDYSKIDFEMGQNIKVGHDSVVLRFHAGVRYADIDTKMTANFEQDGNDNTGVFTAEADWNGLGPRVGVDGAWHLGNGFSIIAEGSAAVLVGDASATQKYFDTDNAANPTEFSVAHRVSHDNKVASNLEARLGLGYDHHFANNSVLNLQAGYHVSHYFDADYKLSNSGSDVGLSGWFLGGAYTV